MKVIISLLTILVITSACNKKLKETVGISTTGPNEYQVQRSKMLEVPPHYDLPNPNSNKATYDNVRGQDNFNDGEQALMKDMN